jgi:hypothetical protein
VRSGPLWHPDGVRSWKPLSLVLVLVPLALAVAGCTSNSSAGDSYTAPGAVPAATVVPPPPVAPVDVPPPPQGRPLTPGEKQYLQMCKAGTVQLGCQNYTDTALRLQGINPDS